MKENDTHQSWIATALITGALSVLLAGCSSHPPPAVPPPPVQGSAPPPGAVPAPPPAALNADQMNRLCQAAPDTCHRVQLNQPLMLEDIKAMTRAGIASDAIIAQVRMSRTVFHLSAAQILDLKKADVTDQVLDFLLNTPSAIAAMPPPPEPQTNPYAAQAPSAPPPPQDETPPPTPGPDYVWVGGDWVWNGGWVWVGGHWAIPPFPGGFWYHGGWRRGWGGYRHYRGHWR